VIHHLDRVKLPRLVGDPGRPEYRFAWWCRSCGVYRPVDDREHCATCVPPWADLLAGLVDVHLRAAVAVHRSAPVTDPEQRWHLDVAQDALALLGRSCVHIGDDAAGEGRGDA
jgi:hypothetical protein